MAVDLQKWRPNVSHFCTSSGVLPYHYIFSAETGDASATISVDVTSNDGHPAMAPHSCGADLGNLQIHFHGDVIDDILDLFEKYISDYVKGKVDGIICDQARKNVPCSNNRRFSGITDHHATRQQLPSTSAAVDRSA